MSNQEVITWIDVKDRPRPDSLREVLVTTVMSEKATAAFFDKAWFCSRTQNKIKTPVIAWAEMPAGPITTKEEDHAT